MLRLSIVRCSSLPWKPAGGLDADAVVVDHGLDLLDPVLARLSGQQAAVDRRLALGGDDVGFDPAVDDRDVERVAKHGVQGGVADDDLLQIGVSGVGGEQPFSLEALHVVARLWGEGDGALPVGEAVERLDQRDGGVVAVGATAVPGRADGGEAEPADVLLVGGDGEELRVLSGEAGRAGAAFAEFELDVEQVGALLGEPFHAPDAAGFFIGHSGEDEVTGEGHSVAFEDQHCDELHDATALHVDGAPAVDPALFDEALEGGLGPVVLLHRHDVRVVAEHHGALGAVAAEGGEERLAVGLDLDVLRLDPSRLQQAAQEARGGGLVSGRVGGVDLEVLDEDLERLVEDGLPVDRRLETSVGHWDSFLYAPGLHTPPIQDGGRRTIILPGPNIVGTEW